MAIFTPGNIHDTSFMDDAPHRAHLLAPYRQYYSHDAAQFKGKTYDEEDYQMATGVLFSTGWAMAQVAATHPENPTALILVDEVV